MNWNEILLWSRIGFIACCALVVQMALVLALSLEARSAQHRPGRHGMPPARPAAVQPVRR